MLRPLTCQLFAPVHPRVCIPIPGAGQAVKRASALALALIAALLVLAAAQYALSHQGVE